MALTSPIWGQTLTSVRLGQGDKDKGEVQSVFGMGGSDRCLGLMVGGLETGATVGPGGRAGHGVLVLA